MNQPNKSPQKQPAIIVDLDETLCTEFDVPIQSGVELLRRISQTEVEVHYVTARTAICSHGTEKFIQLHRLPGLGNIHYCPESLNSFEHKRRSHHSLNKEFEVPARSAIRLKKNRPRLQSAFPSSK